jgi:hypothetical protein
METDHGCEVAGWALRHVLHQIAFRSAVLLGRRVTAAKVIKSKPMIDAIARDLAITRYGLAESLQCPSVPSMRLRS